MGVLEWYLMVLSREGALSGSLGVVLDGGEPRRSTE